MDDLPQPLFEAVQELEKQFTVNTETLKAVSDHFASELTKGVSPGRALVPPPAHMLTAETGLSVEGGNIVWQDSLGRQIGDQRGHSYCQPTAHEPDMGHGLPRLP